MATLTVADVLSAFIDGTGVPDYDGPVEAIGEISLTELGYDSLALLAAFTQVEQRYNVQIPDIDHTKFMTLAQVTDFLNRTIDGR
jgi:acyl carrier protein